MSYAYDANGNRTAMTDASGTSSLLPTTPSTSSPARRTAPARRRRTPTTLDGDTTAITYPLGSGATWAGTDTVTYGYDHADRADLGDGLQRQHARTITNTADGLPSALTSGSSGDTVSTRPTRPTTPPSSITLANGSTLQEFAYSDEPSGAIATETDTPSSALSPADYTYDAAGRVTADDAGHRAARSPTARTPVRNLTTLPTGASGTYDDASELTSSVLSGTTTDYTYDASGNRTARDSRRHGDA